MNKGNSSDLEMLQEVTFTEDSLSQRDAKPVTRRCKNLRHESFTKRSIFGVTFERLREREKESPAVENVFESKDIRRKVRGYFKVSG
jgi:hypothetical protein